MGKEAASLIAQGQVGKAIRRLLSHGVASAEDPAVLQQLQAKYPPRGRPLPVSVPKGAPVENLACL